MATKRRHDEPQPSSPRTPIIILAVGGIAVAALVGWALTRTVETTELPPPVATSTTSGFSEIPPSPTATQASPPLTTTTATPPFPAATPPPAQAGSSASVPRMSVEDLREKSQFVTIIDVRDEAAYRAGHIPGALHIPFARVQGEMASLPKGRPIVTYCT